MTRPACCGVADCGAGKIGGMDESRRTRLPTAFVALAVLSLPILYALSIGPLAWLINNDYIQEGSTAYHVVLAVYSPLTWFAEHCPPFHSIYEWYILQW